MHSLVKTLCMWILLLGANALPFELRSRIKTEEVYRTSNIPSNRIYSIDVKRVDSNKAEEVSRCWSVPRTINVVRN
jgi:hypothetical protein